MAKPHKTNSCQRQSANLSLKQMNHLSLFLALILLQCTFCTLLEKGDVFDDPDRQSTTNDRELQTSNGCNIILRELPDGCTCGPSNVEGTLVATCNRFCERCMSTRRICVTYSLKFEYRRNARLDYTPRAVEYQALYTGRDSAGVGFTYRTNYDTSFNAQSCTSSIDGKDCICEVDKSASCVGELRHNCARAGVTSGVFEACRAPSQIALNSPFIALTLAELRIENCGQNIIPDPRAVIPPKKTIPQRNKDALKLSTPADGGRGSLARKLRVRGSRG